MEVLMSHPFGVQSGVAQKAELLLAKRLAEAGLNDYSVLKKNDRKVRAVLNLVNTELRQSKDCKHLTKNLLWGRIVYLRKHGFVTQDGVLGRWPDGITPKEEPVAEQTEDLPKQEATPEDKFEIP